jgi:hypothetical protein
MSAASFSEKISEIVKRRLIEVDPQTRAGFPPVLHIKNVTWWLIFEDKRFIGLVFVDEAEMARVEDYKNRGLTPFPGLVLATDDRSIPCAFRIDSSKNGVFTKCAVKNQISFSVGKDSTFMVSDHTQSLEKTEAGDLSYNVPLAYIVSYGSEITTNNVCEYLEDLITYSIKAWRPR